MSSLKWTIAAIIGAAIGAALWIGLGSHFGATLGWFAVAVGLLSGIGLRIAAGPAEEGLSRGLTAAIIAVPTILVAKYNVAAQTMVTEEVQYWENFATVDEESLIGTIADQIVLARVREGQSIAWPEEDMTYEDALWEDDYPAEIWAEASKRWHALSPGEQQRRTADHEAEVRRHIDYHLRAPRRAAFFESFSSWDIVWFLLAGAAAFVTGGGYREA